MQFRRQSLGSSEDQKREMLDKAYKDVMERINRQQLGFRRLAEKVLSWITCTKRPLTTLELQHALAVVVGDSKLDEDNLERTERMVSVCAGLVTIDEESGIIRFVHYTTQEYFERTQERWFPDAESEITKTCITYLSFSSFNTGLCATDEQFEARIRENALYRYAAKHWGNHARAALAATDQLVLRFLEKETKLTACTQAMLAPEQYSGQLSYSQNVPQHMIGVHVAAYFGLENTLASLLGNGYDLDVRDTYNRTPLSWATKQGHKAVVRLLLEQDPELELKDNRQGQTPLSLAAKHGHEVIVHQLLEQGAEVESNDKSSKTPLFLAAQKGHEAVVRLLLEWDAEVDSKDTGGHTPLSLAAMYGYVPVVRLLLEQGAEVGSRDTWGHTPLSLAARNGYEAIVRLLLEHGAELWSRDRTGRTPLSYASENGHEEAAKLLLEKAVDLDSRDKDTYYGRTPLLWAARNGHEAIIKLLLEKAVSVDTKDHYGQTALSYVAWHGLEATVRLLLDKAVDVDSKDIYYGRTPLSYASENGHEVVVTLLLGNTVDMQSKSNSGRTPLMYAKENGQEAVVNLLQEKAVDVNSNSNSHWIQLSYVAGNRGKTDNIPKKACESFNRYGADIDH
jgi:ankyrin repeat protein